MRERSGSQACSEARPNLIRVEVFKRGDDAREAGVVGVVDVEAAVAAAHAVVETEADHLRHQRPKNQGLPNIKKSWGLQKNTKNLTFGKQYFQERK